MTAYNRIAEQLKKQIRLRRLAPGGKLPREVELAGALGVSRKTLRIALEELETAGLIVRRKRGGTTVAEDASERVEATLRFGIAYPFGEGAAPPAACGYGFAGGDLLARKMFDAGAEVRIINADDREVPEDLDGMIVPVPMASLPLMRLLVEKRIPHVALEYYCGIPGSCAVTADDEEAARECVRDLYRHGFRAPAFIGGNLGAPEMRTGFRRRTEAFSSECATLGMTLRPERIFNVEQRLDPHYDMAALLENFPERIKGADSIVCGVGLSVLELEKLRRICGETLFPALEIRCVDLHPFNEPGMWHRLERFSGFFKPHQTLADESWRRLWEWMGDPAFVPREFKIPFERHEPNRKEKNR